MRDTPMSVATSVEHDHQIGTAEVLLEVCQVVTGSALGAAVKNFRRWDHLVPKPLPVSAYSLTLRQAQDLLRSVGMSSALIRRAFDMFARRRERANSWSRVLGEAPERRIDALELFSGLALTCRAPLKDKLSILFYLFDSGETGVLTEDDLGAMIASCASVLRHLKLSLPISNDEAAFAAGAAFGHRLSRGTGSTAGGCGNCELEDYVDEIGLPVFLTWAQRAELPSCALEMLALPHRLSRVVDLVSSKTRSMLRNRYFPETGAKHNPRNASSMAGRKVSGECKSSWSETDRIVPAQRSDRANMLPPLQGGDGRFVSQTFSLTPYLGRIGPHSANALFEIGTSIYPAAPDSTWLAVVSVEERCGCRLSLVDSETLNFRVGAPGILLMSNLRAATDHRLTISWRGATETRKNGDVNRTFSGAHHTRAGSSTLRFTTLPPDSLIASLNPDNKGSDRPSSNESVPSNKQRRRIALVSAWEQGACPFDEGARLQPYATNNMSGNSANSKGVSVLINHGQRTCLEAAERGRGLDPWWNAPAGSTVTDPASSDQTSAHLLVQSWPFSARPSSRGVSVSPSAGNLGNFRAFPSVSGFAPFSGEAVVRNEVPGEEKAVPWASDGEIGSGGIDLMVHLSPDWRAVEAVRRCFQVLKRCRFESPTIREDGRRVVSSEVSTAIRALMTRCFRARRGELRDGARRSYAHIVLGDLQHPWLGLKEDELKAHDEEHLSIVRSEIESTLRRYLVVDGADPGRRGDEGERGSTPRFFSTSGGTMAIGCGCFLIRPTKPHQPGGSDASPPTSSRGHVENTADSATPSSLSEVILPSEATSGEEDKSAGTVSATTGTADDGAGLPTRRNSSSTDTSTTPGTVNGVGDDPEVDAEASGRNVLTANGQGVNNSEEYNPVSQKVEGERRNSGNDATPENTEKSTAVRAEVEVEAGLKPPTPTDNVDGTTTAHAVDDQTADVGLAGVDDGEQHTPDAASEKRSTIRKNDENFPELSENSALNALLSEMTSVADSWASAAAARLTRSGNQHKQANADTPGCTAIIFLDAPLIAPDVRPRPRSQREKKEEYLVVGPRHESMDQQAHPVQPESAEPEAMPTLPDDISAPRHGSSRSSDVNSAATIEPANLDESSNGVDEGPGNGGGGDHDSIGLSEEHPAGLGDPSGALESLLAWMGEGGSSGRSRREILLVCSSGGNPPLSREERRRGSFDGNGSATSTSARQDSVSPRGHGENSNRQSPDARRTEHNDGGNVGGRNREPIVRANDVNVILQGGKVEETVASGGEGHASRVDGEERLPGTIRQIVLGGSIPIQVVPQQQGQKPASGTTSKPHQVDRDERQTETMKTPSVVARIRNKTKNNDDNNNNNNNNNNDNNNNNNNSDTGRSSLTQPAPPSYVHLPPSEVLLQTRPTAPTGEGLPRVAVAFPPPAVSRSASWPTRETEKCSSKAALEEPFAERSGSTSSSDSVRVVVGPVIGRVGPTSGIVLVEVDLASTGATRQEEEVAELHFSDGVGVRLTDTLTGQTRQMTGGTWAGGQPGEGPRLFEFEGLAPGRRYALRLSGVRQRDQKARTGGFCTPLQGESLPAMWTLSPLAVPVEALEEILADVQTARPTCMATLTVGSMVDASKVGQALYPLIMAEKKSGSQEGLPIGARALREFRELYRYTWEEPRMRKLLANASTTPSSAGAGDLLLPILRNFPPGWLPLSATACRSPPRSKRTRARKKASTAGSAGGRGRGCAREAAGVARALRAVAGAALQASKEYQEALLGGAANHGAGGSGGGGHRVGKGPSVSNAPLGATGRGGPLPTFQRWGAVGVLSVSVASSQVDCALGGWEAGRRLLSVDAWAWLDAFFRSPETGWQEGPGLSTLVVVTDSPLIWRSPSSSYYSAAAASVAEHRHQAAPPQAAEREARDPRDHNQEGGGVGVGGKAGQRGYERAKKKRLPFSFRSPGGSRDAPPSWSAHPREAASLLSLLFSWANGGGDDDYRAAREQTTRARREVRDAVGDSKVRGSKALSSHASAAKAAAASGGGKPGRSFSVVCPATRVRMNVETYVKDSETGRVAVQWCLASKENGDEAHVPMSGCIGPRFSFTHYPQPGTANGPGATLLRPFPDPLAPFVKFLGMSPRGGGGPGLALGTVGPILGEVGSSTARVLAEVSVPMELRLTVRKLGATRKGAGTQPVGHWQQLTKIVREAHRPVVFEVDGLIADTSYMLDFSPLANESEFRASLRTRALRPFSFRVAAFGGSRHPFGFLPVIGAAGAGGTEQGATASPSTAVSREVAAKYSAGKVPLSRERWPFRLVESAQGHRSGGGGAGAVVLNGGRVATRKTVGAEKRARDTTVNPGAKDRDGAGGSSNEAAGGGHGEAGGGWRQPFSTALSISSVTDEARLADRERESLFGVGGVDALSLSAELGRLSAWKVLADEVELPVQGLDLVIHLGNEINAAACLNLDEIGELTASFTQRQQGLTLRPRPNEAASLAEGQGAGAGIQTSNGTTGGGSRGGRSLLVKPPQLPVEDPAALGRRDEEDISLLEEFFVTLHDEAERDRKRSDGNFRYRSIPDPSLAIHTQLPEDEEQERREEAEAAESAGEDVDGGGGGGETGLGGGASVAAEGARGAGDAQEAWALVKEEVAERVRDPYRVAWGLPWPRAVMASAPNAFLAFTPSDLDDGCQHLSATTGGRRRESAAADGDDVEARPMDHPASVARIREERLRAWVEYQAGLGPEGGKQLAVPLPPAPEAPARGGDKQSNGKDDGGGGGGGGGGKSKNGKREADRGAYREYGGIGVLMLDVWGNQPWRLDEPGLATAKGEEDQGPGFHPKALLSKRQEKLVKKALTSSSTNALLICSGTPMVAEPIVHPKAPPLSEVEQKARDKTLNFAKKELKKLGKAGLAEIKRMTAEEKIPKLAMLSPEEIGAMGSFYDETRPCFHWSYHSPYLQELLEKLFDWASDGAMPTKKNQQPKKRDVFLICGGTGCGVRTQVRDRRTGASFTQLCVGRMSDRSTPCPWPLSDGTIGDRIVFTHSPLLHLKGGVSPPKELPDADAAAPRQTISSPGVSSSSSGSGDGDGNKLGGKSSFALVTILSEPLEASMSASLVSTPNGQPVRPSRLEGADRGAGDMTKSGSAQDDSDESQEHRQQNEDGPAVILGPVVGRVEVVAQSGVVRESCCVPVVLEVDRGGDVACVMRDVATSETFREERTMERRRPRAFWMQGLRPARRYAIEFEGVSNKKDRTGSLTTPDSSHPDMAIVAVSHDRPGEFPSGGEINLWGALEERLRSPWQGVEAIIHVGGQVDLSNAFEDGKTCLERLEERRRAGRVSEEEETSTMKGLKERFRDEYRKAWNQPCTRKVLASCQHIMMWGQGECRSGYGRGEHAVVSSWAGRRLLRVAKEVFHEYQRQLWDPSWGCRFQVGDNESFYLSFRRGTVGILSLDALELSPQWKNSNGDTGDHSSELHPEGTKKRGPAPSGSELEVVAKFVGVIAPSKEVPLLGEAQWQRLREVLEEQEALVTLIVVTETPIAWHDTEAFLGETKDATGSGDGTNTAPPAHLQDHWAARPTQQRALLKRLFQWKAESGGKEVVLLSGAGLAEGCVAAETRLEYNLPSKPSPASGSEEEKEQKQKRGLIATGDGGNKGKGENEKDEEGEKPKKAKRRRVGLEQVTCGPITAEPVAPPSTTTPPSKGKLFVPLTEAEKEQKRLIKASSYKTTASGGSNGAALVGGRRSAEDQEPVEFVHLKTWGRNYAVLQVIADNDEEGPIGVVDSALTTSSSLDKTHPLQELSRPPRWWSQRCIGDRTVLFDDGVYLKGQGYEATMEVRKWLETSEDFTQAIRRCYDDFYIADCGRPADLRTIRVEKAVVLKRHVEDGIRAVYSTLPTDVANELAYVPDQMILDFLFIKACPEVKTSALDTAEKWEEVCRQTCIQAAFIRVAALWAEEEEEVLLMADARAEEAARKAEVKLKKARELEIKDAERDAAEMADLMANDPEAHMRRVVQKRAEDADRRRRERKAETEDKSLAEGERVILEKKKEEDKERLARESKEKEAKEQQELNELADSDPVEYDRRIKEWQKRKLEGRDGTSSSLDVHVDQTQNGDLERRKSLARERRDARRAAMHARPSIGTSKKKKI